MRKHDRLLGLKRFVRGGRSHSWKAEEIYRREPTGAPEVAQLFHSAGHCLESALDEEKSPADRRRSAYRAALHLAAVVLRASGYRTRRPHDDQGVFWALADLFGPEGRGFSEAARSLRTERGWEACSPSRWVAEITAFRESVLEWLARNHAELLPPTPTSTGPASRGEPR